MNEEELYFEEVKELGERFYTLTSNFNTNFPKVLNLESEKKKFFQALIDDKVYNPFFRYERKKYDETKIKDFEKFKVNTENDLFGFKTLYQQRHKTKLYEIYCHKNWGKPLSTKYVRKYRGEPSYFLLLKALSYIKGYSRETVKFKTLSIEEVSKRLKKEVKRLTNNNIKVKKTVINSKVNIAPNLNLIQINKNERFTTLDVKRLKVHEIGVHYMRYFNGHNTRINILEVGTSNYIETEEGLAVYSEELKGVNSKAQMFIYAGRVVATYYALRKSFYDVFHILKKYGFSDDIAFSITFRAKRNLCDTSKKGGFTKDYVYFSGYHKIKRFAKNHDIKDLFIGKVKLEDLKLLRNYIQKNKKDIKTIF